MMAVERSLKSHLCHPQGIIQDATQHLQNEGYSKVLKVDGPSWPVMDNYRWPKWRKKNYYISGFLLRNHVHIHLGQVTSLGQWNRKVCGPEVKKGGHGPTVPVYLSALVFYFSKASKKQKSLILSILIRHSVTMLWRDNNEGGSGDYSKSIHLSISYQFYQLPPKSLLNIRDQILSSNDVFASLKRIIFNFQLK